jgi:pimeloyl-ACP methyl ester carboxylesterase
MNYQRENVEFRSHTSICRAWFYEPTRPATASSACIVMGHGLGGTRNAGLEPYAHRFAEAGFAVLLFDYRHFGDSDGLPRQLVSIKRQLQDWAAAIAYARSLPGVDSARIALWGSSFSGGHVIVVAARDNRVAAVSAQGPMMDGLAATLNTVRYAGFGAAFKLVGLGLFDVFRAVLGLSPVYVPLVAPPGRLATMSTQDAEPGYTALVQPDWRNEICARFALTLATYRPISHAGAVRCPVLIQVCATDSVAPARAAITTARKIGAKAHLKEYDCGHFDIYVGKGFERSSSDQLAFFNRVLLGRK